MLGRYTTGLLFILIIKWNSFIKTVFFGENELVERFLIGLNHSSGFLPELRAKMVGKRFFGRNKTLFIEALNPDEKRRLLFEKMSVIRNSPIEKLLRKKFDKPDCYEALLQMAREKGMMIVFLDSKEIVGKQISNFLAKKEEEWHYTAVQLREKSWMHKLREAKPGDVIVMHPVHAVRVLERAKKTGLRFEPVFFNRPPRGVNTPKLHNSYWPIERIKKLGTERNKLRRI